MRTNLTQAKALAFIKSWNSNDNIEAVASELGESTSYVKTVRTYLGSKGVPFRRYGSTHYTLSLDELIHVSEMQLTDSGITSKTGGK